MLSRFSITTTFAYQNTIYFLRFQTIYYFFLILFYYFCIMFLCFFLSIYFFGYFYPLFHSQKIIYIILHSKKRVPDATDFHSATSYPSLFPLQHVSLYDILQLILLYFPETVFFAILSYDFNYSAGDIYFTEAYVMNLYAIKEKCQHGSIQVPYSYYDCGIPDYFTSVPLHWHSEMELNYIKSGNGFFKYEDQTISAKPGDIFLIQPNVLHAIMSDEHSSFFYDTIVFHQNMLVGSYDDRCYTDILLPIFSSRRRVLVPVSQETPGYHELHDSVRTIMQCAHKNLATSDLLLKSELLRLFYLLASTPGLCTEHTVSTESRMTETLRPVLTYIQKHHSESVTIEQLAKIAHMSSSYFMSCFKQNFGLGAIEYLNQVRIRSACDLLRNTDRNISDIAFDTGFHNLSNFNRQFRTKVGCSPQTYRKESVLS